MEGSRWRGEGTHEGVGGTDGPQAEGIVVEGAVDLAADDGAEGEGRQESLDDDLGNHVGWETRQDHNTEREN